MNDGLQFVRYSRALSGTDMIHAIMDFPISSSSNGRHSSGVFFGILISSSGE